MEGGGFLLPTLDACQLTFPLSREGGIGNAHPFHYGVESQPLLGGHERLLATLHVATGKEGLDDGGTGGGSAYSTFLHGLTHFLVLHVLACRLHRRKQGGFGMQGLRLGLALGEADAAYGKGVAALPRRKYLFIVLFAQHGTPSRLTDDAALGGKLRLTAEGGDGGEFLDALVGEGFHHAPGYHLIDGVVLFREEQRFLACDEQGVVVGHLAVIHAAAGQPVPVGYLANPFWIAAQEGEQLGNFGKDIFGDVAAAGARISDELLLVELLRYLQCLLRREAVLGVGFLLQGGEVVEQRRVLYLLLALHLGDEQGGLRLYLIIYVLRRGLLLPFLYGRELHWLFPCAVHR